MKILRFLGFQEQGENDLIFRKTLICFYLKNKYKIIKVNLLQKTGNNLIFKKNMVKYIFFILLVHIYMHAFLAGKFIININNKFIKIKKYTFCGRSLLIVFVYNFFNK